ncbi:ATP-binding protein [Kribbella sp. NBC_00709]|uniref:ATP-binding protein n=1 Tax=Kribbella sp. NBC_00709 TaxID=2975972 RepID=UPI003FA6003F
MVRHAQASEVTVEVNADSQQVVARITDNGVGIGDQHRSSGLRNLTERAQAPGGTVRVTDNQPHGTIVELRAPLADN